MLTLERTTDAFARIGVKHAQGYSLIKDGRFPKPVTPFERPSRVPAHEVDAVIAATISGASNEELCELVRSLHKKRSTYGEKLNVFFEESSDVGKVGGTHNDA